MLAAVLGWVLPCQSTPSLLHKRPKGRFGLLSIVYINKDQHTQFLYFQKLYYSKYQLYYAIQV